MKTEISRGWLLKFRGMAAILAMALTWAAGASEPDLEQVYAPYQALLERHLRERDLPRGGLISAFDYRAALASPDSLELLDEQRERLAGFDRTRLETRAPALAFWVNAYNYFMLDYLLRNPDDGRPADSVRDYGHLLDPYALFGRKLFEVGGRDYSLREIELEVLLGEAFAQRGWKDARIHFMVNCASVGCPPLRKQIYTADNLDAMLAENTRRALDTPLHLARDGDRLRLTSLFDWYAEDFADQSGSVRGFIRDHGSEHAQQQLRATDRIDFIDYDWSLNSPENFDAVLREIGAETFE
ncbi:MAG: DUF547 domain-containing protein [Wenzhouxiangellaceae bacterium]|jgi:hypothetical protein|nr:DUF547 domain-containing protein [Wenzhouxiangellaceae bacterium]